MESEQLPASIKRGRPRCAEEPASPVSITKRRKCQDPLISRRRDDETRASKGLRHFSKQVCDKVAEKGVTTYNEKRSFDQKNIRRRVYDALNVLMAMNIIAKDKKQIKWLGIPAHYHGSVVHQQQYQQDQHQEVDAELDRYLKLQKLVEEEEHRQAQLLSSLNRARGSIHEKLTRHLQLCNLIWRNQRNQNPTQKKVSLPFFAIAADDDVHVEVASDGLNAEITQSTRSAGDQQIYEDTDILRCLGMNCLSRDQLAAWIPDQTWHSLLSIRPGSSCDDTIYIQPCPEMVPATSSYFTHTHTQHTH
ncbi:E2F/DP family winged-helix DNA-binding domain-containing protein [Dichotomocladium elegans]|nr:E2F/DP family winged-helix DNA-binding domain-containing protein [Dichotomocladium elegans]